MRHSHDTIPFMRRGAALVACAVCAAGALSACQSDTDAVTATAPQPLANTAELTPTTPPRADNPADNPAAREACSPQQLQAILEPGSAGAGHETFTLKVTNSTTPCSIAGFPGVSAVDAHGEQLGAPAQRTGEAAADTLRLGPGQSAIATLRLTQARLLDPGECHPTTAAGLKVFPPNSFESFTVDFDREVCGAVMQHGESTLTISPFQPA